MNRLILTAITATMLSACGGGGGLPSPNVGNDLSDSTSEDAQQTVGEIYSDEHTLARFEGLWKGNLTTYLDGTTNKRCEWQVTLHLTDERVPDSGTEFGGYQIYSTFLGTATAELLYDANNECKSTSYAIEWDDACFVQCSLFMDAADNNYHEIQGAYNTLDYLILGADLSVDGTTISLSRNDIDDDYLRLTK